MRDQHSGGSSSHKRGGDSCNRHCGTLHHQHDDQNSHQTKLHSALSMSSQSIPKSTKRWGPSSSSQSRMRYSFIGWGSITVTGGFWRFGMLRLGEFFWIFPQLASWLSPQSRWSSVVFFQPLSSSYHPLLFPQLPPADAYTLPRSYIHALIGSWDMTLPACDIQKGRYLQSPWFKLSQCSVFNPILSRTRSRMKWWWHWLPPTLRVTLVPIIKGPETLFQSAMFCASSANQWSADAHGWKGWGWNWRAAALTSGG